MRDNGLLDQAGNGLQCCADKTIPWRIDGEFCKPASHQAAIQQLVPFSGQHINTPTNAAEPLFPRSVAQAQLTVQPSLNGMRQNFCHQIGQFIWVFFDLHMGGAAGLKQVRRIQYQEPKVPDRYAPHESGRDP